MGVKSCDHGTFQEGNTKPDRRCDTQYDNTQYNDTEHKDMKHNDP